MKTFFVQLECDIDDNPLVPLRGVLYGLSDNRRRSFRGMEELEGLLLTPREAGIARERGKEVGGHVSTGRRRDDPE